MDEKKMEDRIIQVAAGDDFWKLLDVIFTDEFMQKYTNFDSFEPFKYSSAVMVTWGKDEMIYQKSIFDGFVNESTQFATWDEMIMKATDERFAGKEK